MVDDAGRSRPVNEMQHPMEATSLDIRRRASALDFIYGVKPIFEKRLRAKVYPIEEFDSSQLAKRLDMSGIDAFYYEQDKQPRTLGSRMRWEKSAKDSPTFSLRYALYNPAKKYWDTSREFYRKARALADFNELIVCPKLHIESFSRVKGSGEVEWSFSVDTRHLIQFVYDHWDNPDRVIVFQPSKDEPRKVILVPIDQIKREYPVDRLL